MIVSGKMTSITIGGHMVKSPFETLRYPVMLDKKHLLEIISKSSFKTPAAVIRALGRYRSTWDRRFEDGWPQEPFVALCGLLQCDPYCIVKSE